MKKIAENLNSIEKHMNRQDRLFDDIGYLVDHGDEALHEDVNQLISDARSIHGQLSDCIELIKKDIEIENEGNRDRQSRVLAYS